MAQHGREVNGTEVLRRLHDRLLDADISGRAVAVTVADPLTFDRMRYATSEGFADGGAAVELRDGGGRGGG